MINYLVKIVSTGRLGIVKSQDYTGYFISFNPMKEKWVEKYKVIIFSNKPVSNSFYSNGFCYWCKERLKYYSSNGKVKNKNYFTYYCPKCLR